MRILWKIGFSLRSSWQKLICFVESAKSKLLLFIRNCFNPPETGVYDQFFE